MNRLVKNIIILLVPFILVLIFLPVNKRLFYQGLKEDCMNHATWIYDRIHNNPKPIDVVFLGSSHTINGINDSLIQDSLGQKLHLVNFGYCRLGTNLYYTLLKEIVEKRKIKTLVIEIREDENRYSHPIFPYLSETNDVVSSTVLFNKNYISDYYNHFYYKLEIIKKDLFNEIDNKEKRVADFGFSTNTDTASVELLNSIREKSKQPKIELSAFERNFHMKYPRSYIKKIAQLCEKEKIELKFLYLPQYGNENVLPKESETYSKYGTIIIPDKSIFENQDNWHDENHLNKSGANQLSKWLSRVLIKN